MRCMTPKTIGLKTILGGYGGMNGGVSTVTANQIINP